VQVCWFDFDKWPPQNLRKDIAMSTFFDDPALVGLSRQWSLLEVQDTSCEWDLNFDRLIHIWGARFLDLGSGLMEALEGTLFIKLTLIFAIICLANYLPGACLELVGKIICWWRRRSHRVLVCLTSDPTVWWWNSTPLIGWKRMFIMWLVLAVVTNCLFSLFYHISVHD